MSAGCRLEGALRLSEGWAICGSKQKRPIWHKSRERFLGLSRGGVLSGCGCRTVTVAKPAQVSFRAGAELSRHLGLRGLWARHGSPTQEGLGRSQEQVRGHWEEAINS